MKKSGNRVDSNHVVKETKEIPTGKTAAGTTSFLDQTDKRHSQQSYQSERHKTFQNTGSPDVNAHLQFLLPGNTGTGSKSVSSDVIEVETQGIVSRILASAGSNSAIREDGVGKKPVCLATRSPKTKPKPLRLANVAHKDNQEQAKDTGDIISGGRRRQKDVQDPKNDSERFGKMEDFNSGDTMPKVHSSDTQRGKGEVESQTISTTEGDGSSQSMINKHRMGKLTPPGNGTNENVSEKDSNPGCSKGEIITKSARNEKREGLIKQKRSSLGVADGKDSQSDDRHEICCPPLPASLSRDSGISSPSVDEVKTIDQRGDEPKDNEDQMKGLRVEKGENPKAHKHDEMHSYTGRADNEGAGKDGMKENIKQPSMSANDVESPVPSRSDLPQSVDGTVTSQMYLSSSLPSATLPETGAISCQGESNLVVSPHTPIGSQTDKVTVTALGIDLVDTHAPQESGPASSDMSDTEPATSVNSTSVDVAATRLPIPCADQAPFSSATSDEGGRRYADGCDLDEVNVNTNKAIVISTNQITSPDSCSNAAITAEQTDLTASSAVEQTHSCSTKDTQIVQQSSLTRNQTAEPATCATTNSSPVSTSTSLYCSSLTSADICDEIPITKHINQSHKQEHRISEPVNPSESVVKRDQALEKEQEKQEHREQHEKTLSPNCSPSLSNKNIVKAETVGFEDGGSSLTQVSVDIEPGQNTEEGVTTSEINIAFPNNGVASSSKPVECGDAIAAIGTEALDTVPPLKPKRARLNFRDINIQEVISLEADSSEQKLKGILKSKSHGCIRETDNNIRVNGRERFHSTRSVSFKKTHTKSTFSYYNAAFEGEIREEPSRRPSLADVVSHIMRTNAVVDIEEEDDNSHPYGRDNSLTDLINGKRRDTYNMDAGKMIVWFALAIMIVSLAGVIIFMSESYNLTHEAETIPLPPDDTTLSHS